MYISINVKLELGPQEQGPTVTPGQKTIEEDTDELLKKMKKGINCSPNYSLRNPGCSKCRKYDGHYEFLCPTYQMYNPNTCRICKNGQHFERNCVEKHAIPAPVLNNTTMDTKTDLISRIQALLLEEKN